MIRVQLRSPVRVFFTLKRPNSSQAQAQPQASNAAQANKRVRAAEPVPGPSRGPDTAALRSRGGPASGKGQFRAGGFRKIPVPLEEYWASHWRVRYDIRKTHKLRGIPLPYSTQCPPELRHLVPKGKETARKERRRRLEAQRHAQAGPPSSGGQVAERTRPVAQDDAQEQQQRQQQRPSEQQERRGDRAQSPKPDDQEEEWEEVGNRGKGGPFKGKGKRS